MAAHLIYNAFCYIPYSFVLFILTLFIPGIACFPNLLRTPLLFAILPIISICIDNAFAFTCFELGIYQHSVILGLNVLLTAAALIRGYQFLQRPLSLQAWRTTDSYLILCNFSLLLPLIAFAGLSAFMSNDALASWNYWALNFYHGVYPDTIGYPPFFPLFLSYCYHLMGNTEYQGVVKVLLIALPWCMMNIIALINPRTTEHLGLYLLLVCAAVFPTLNPLDFYRFYAVGYADPMLAAAMAAALSMLLKYLAEPDNKWYLLFTLICSSAVSLSKQPGMLWLGLALPLLLFYKTLHTKKFQRAEWLGWLLSMLPLIVWLVYYGSGFYHNDGVLTASLHQGTVSMASTFAALTHSIHNYLLLQPLLLLLFIIASFSAWHDRYQRLLCLTFLLPGILLWFIFGSYDLRLGLYLCVTAGILVAANTHRWTSQTEVPKTARTMQKVTFASSMLGAACFMVFSITDQINPHLNMPYHIYPLEAGRSNLYHYFGEQAPYLYQHIYGKENVKIYAPNRMIAGIFYGHTTIIPTTEDTSPRGIYANLQQYQPDFVFAALCKYPDAWDCRSILQFINAYPNVLIPIPLPHAEYGHRLYAVNKHALRKHTN